MNDSCTELTGINTCGALMHYFKTCQFGGIPKNSSVGGPGGLATGYRIVMELDPVTRSGNNRCLEAYAKHWTSRD